MLKGREEARVSFLLILWVTKFCPVRLHWTQTDYGIIWIGPHFILSKFQWRARRILIALKENFQEWGWKYSESKQKTFTGTVLDEKHSRVKTGGSKTVSMVSCSLESWPMQGRDSWNKHILPSRAGRPTHLSHAGSMDAENAGSPCRRTKVQALGSACTATGTELPLLLVPELHHHPQEVSLLWKGWFVAE